MNDPSRTTNLAAQIDELLRASREADALPLLQEMRRREPNSVQAAWTTGVILYNTRQFAEAVDVLRSCMRLAPQAADVRLLLGKAAFSAGLFDGAESAALAATALQPGSAVAIELLARVLLKKEASADAERRFRDCILLGAAAPETLADLGAALQNQLKFAAAVEAYRRSMDAGQTNPDVVLSLANCLFMLGMPRAALLCAKSLGPDAMNEKLDLLRLQAERLTESLSGVAYRDDHPVKRRNLANTKHLIAVCRHTNHLDHLLPILHAWIARDDHVATMLFGGHVVGEEDYRMVYMKRVGIEVAQFSELLPIDHEPGMAALLDLLAPDTCEAAILCEQGPHPLDLVMASSARARNLPVVGTPAGEDNMLNQMTRKDQYVPPETKERSFGHLDTVIFANDVLPPAELRNSEGRGVSVVLGSVRYCRDWLNFLRQIVPPLDITVEDGLLRVVVFLVNEVYPVNWKEMARTVQMLLSIPRLCVVVQPHPRLFEPQLGVVNPDGSVADLLGFLRDWAAESKDRNPESTLIIAEKINYGASLIEWGDVFLSFSTSIAYQAIMQRKPVLDLSYAHGNYTAIAHYLPISDMRSLDHVWEAIHRIKEAKEAHRALDFYDEQQHQTFVRTLIECGDVSPLERHVRYFEGLVRRPVAQTTPG